MAIELPLFPLDVVLFQVKNLRYISSSRVSA
jgi:hypothetical protein